MRDKPLRVVRLNGAVACGECGFPAHTITIFVDHTTTTHAIATAGGYCVTIGAKVEQIRRSREGLGTNGYQK